MFNVSLPMIMPALAYAGVLVFFLGFEVFGLVLVLGDPEGHLVLATYLYKLTNKLGTPSYHLMAAVAVCLVAVTMPLVMLQRWLLKSANKYVSIKGKGARQKPLPLGTLEVAGACACSAPGSWSPSCCRCPASCCAPSSSTGARASSWPTC